MTSVQAESVRGLGAFHGGLYVDYTFPILTETNTLRFMAASKVLGEETIAGSQQLGGSDT